MMNIRNSRILGLLPIIFFSGCLEFKSIEQPSSVTTNETFTVFIEATSPIDGQFYFGVRLPNGWTIPGDAIPYTGRFNGTIIYDTNLTLEQESISPSPEGYYWWVGGGDATFGGFGAESAYAEVKIQTNHQTGHFSIDYMLGDSFYELNENRSDNHLIEVVDEYSPRELQAVVEGDKVSLSWRAPFMSEGLIGYNVYRDGQNINTDLVVDTFYVDGNPVQELVSYTISSLYANGDAHFTSYEIKVLVFSGGTGDPNDPYQITTAVQLASFSIADFPNLLDKCFVLVNDIDLDPNMPGGQVFDRAVIAPDIRESEDDFQYTGFTGKFDGNGFRISNLTIVGQDYLSLFGAIHDGSQVWNLGIVDANVIGTGSHIGILAGYNSGNMTNCYSTGSVSGDRYVGGLVGVNGGSITTSYSTGTVTGNEVVGGLIGRTSGVLAESWASVDVSGDLYVGGLAGATEGTVSNCYAKGNALGRWYIGGLVGFNSSAIILDCYAIGRSHGDSRVGGLIGQNFEVAILACFWDKDTSGLINMCGTQGDNAAGCDDNYGMITTEMQTAATFLEADWDFVDETYNGTEDIWWIDEGQDYPRLWWERSTDDMLFLVVDDFESYNDLNEEEAGSNRLYDTWIDGFYNPTINGSTVGDLMPPFAYWMIAHTGEQSMPYYYDNSGPANYSEATANVVNLKAGHDWTKHGFKTLSLWFRRFMEHDPWFGGRENDPEPTYVSLANTNDPATAVYHDDPNVTQIAEWTEWRIDLQVFADQGVDLTNINTISIGFGYKNNPQPGGSGKMHFDDIRLYRPDSQEQTP